MWFEDILYQIDKAPFVERVSQCFPYQFLSGGFVHYSLMRYSDKMTSLGPNVCTDNTLIATLIQALLPLFLQVGRVSVA